MKIFASLALTLLLVSCGPAIHSSFATHLQPLSTEQKVALLDIDDEVPAGAKKIGEAKFGDTGFSTDCSFDSNLIKARQLARESGANIVKVYVKKYPNYIITTCYRIKVIFYSYDGDVSKLKQYQIKIK